MKVGWNRKSRRGLGHVPGKRKPPGPPIAEIGARNCWRERRCNKGSLGSELLGNDGVAIGLNNDRSGKQTCEAIALTRPGFWLYRRTSASACSRASSTAYRPPAARFNLSSRRQHA